MIFKCEMQNKYKIFKSDKNTQKKYTYDVI